MGYFGTIFWLNCSGKQRTQKILMAVGLAVFNVSPYKSTVLFLISTYSIVSIVIFILCSIVKL